MDGGNEQGVNIKFCFKAGKSATETLVLVQKAYGNEAVKRSNVFRWYSRFRDVRYLVEDDDRGGRPKSTRTEVNIAAVAADIADVCPISLCFYITKGKTNYPVVNFSMHFLSSTSAVSTVDMI
jgi:hypothetical protein